MNQGKKVILIIMDGWGLGDKSRADLISNTPTPHIDDIHKTAAYSTLKCSGLDVGLPDGQMGNSEVGHLNIGAGRVVYQDFVRVNLAVEDGSMAQNIVLNDAFAYASASKRKVHFFGLVSEGGVHSSTRHLMKMCDIAQSHGLKDVFIHAFTDGRDTDPYSGLGYVNELEAHLKNSAGRIASVCGRYYAMDRDKRWERVKQAYDLLRLGTGNSFKSAVEAIQASYDNGITDEFIKPSVITDDNNLPLALLEEGDVVICFNFRTDRLREITAALTQKSFPDFGMEPMPLYYVTLTKYDESFRNVHVMYDKDDIKKTLGEIVSANGKTQLRIAETEKYPHVTFFFSGGREEPFENESRCMIASPKVATYDLKPSMSAIEIKDAVIREMKEHMFDFICLNFANTDMVGHTGIPEAIKEAIVTVDACVGEVVRECRKLGYAVLVTADHGNADFAINSDGTPNTAHSTNPVPLFLLDNDYKSIEHGKLADIAPTVLTLMNIPVPEEMTGNVLINKKL